MKLEGKVALITGGATGIGRAIAMGAANEGARVVIVDINDDQGARTAKAIDGVFVHCDAGDEAEVRHASDRAIELFGGIDVLVTAAADTGSHRAATDLTADQWSRSLAISLDGAFFASKHAIASMLERGGGSIVHIASVEGMMGAANHAAYVTAKSALFGLTRSLAIDYGYAGIRVNAISPGIIDSDRPDIRRAKSNPEHMRFWQGMTVLGRMGRPEEIASVAIFLASDEASYLTGQNIAVDGGWTIGHPPVPNAGVHSGAENHDEPT